MQLNTQLITDTQLKHALQKDTYVMNDHRMTCKFTVEASFSGSTLGTVIVKSH